MNNDQTNAVHTNGVTPSAPNTTPAVMPAAPQRVFRTYASDLAALGHLEGSRIQKAPTVAPPPTPAPIKEPPIVVPEPPKELTQPPRPPMPPPAPPAPPAPVVLPSDEERNAILRRLRERTETMQKLEGTTPAPPPPPAPAPAPLPPPVAVVPLAPKPVEEASLSPIHTYKSDFADTIRSEKASAASVLASEADAPRKAAAPVRKSSIAFAAGGIFVVILGGAGIYLAYQYAAANKIIVAPPVAPSLIFVDERKEVSGTGRELLASLASAAEATLAPGAVRLTYITEVSTSTAGIVSTGPASGGALVAALRLPAPDLLLRSIRPESTVGAVNAGSEQRAFFILKTDSFERSFAGMLAWEPTVAEDLGTLYPAYPVEVAAPAPVTTTATGTPKTSAAAPPAPPALAVPGFYDEVVASHDVRVLRDSSGSSVLLYGYWDQTTLIIARDEAAFTELVNRLATTRQQ